MIYRDPITKLLFSSSLEKFKIDFQRLSGTKESAKLFDESWEEALYRVSYIDPICFISVIHNQSMLL